MGRKRVQQERKKERRKVRSKQRRAARAGDGEEHPSNPFEYADRQPEYVRLPLDVRSSCPHRRLDATAVPSVVHQAWLGGGKLMFAKLLSILSVRYVLRPEHHYLYYDRADDSLEWRCACKLAECVQVTLPARLSGGQVLAVASDPSDRYASDRLGRCGNIQLDLLRLDALQRRGGIYLDLDSYVLDGKSDQWCGRGAKPTDVGIDDTGRLNHGMIVSTASSPFLAAWRARIEARYDPQAWDFGACNQTTELAAEMPTAVHLSRGLGPLPRYASRQLYDAHLAKAELAHLSAFRHPWRLHDIMNARHLERIWERVGPAVNQTADDDVSRTDPLLQQCVATVAKACWLRPGGKCGIYGA